MADAATVHCVPCLACLLQKAYNYNSMMEFWAGTWSDFGAIIGIAVSSIGLGWAIWEARGARTASIAAQEAATQTRDQITRHLQVVDLQRAIVLIQRIKNLHDNSRWEESRELYQQLREMLSDVIVRSPENQVGVREKLATARTILREMEDSVRRRVSSSTPIVPERERTRLNQRLNGIQSDLEELASTVGFGDSQGEAK